jgi:hypothetical protein
MYYLVDLGIRAQPIQWDGAKQEILANPSYVVLTVNLVDLFFR